MFNCNVCDKVVVCDKFSFNGGDIGISLMLLTCFDSAFFFNNYGSLLLLYEKTL